MTARTLPLKRVRPLALIGALVCGLVASPAWADETSNKAQARVLFDSAMAATKQGRYSDDICAQFAESQRLDAALGTQFYLAECLEKTGKLASAWANYMDVAELANGQGLGIQEKYAREKAQTLKPQIPKLIIVLPSDVQKTEGLEVRRDGVLLAAAQYGLALPVDGGKHVISVVARGKRQWETTVQAPTGTEGATITVTIPALQAEPAVGPVGPGGGADGSPAKGGWSGQHTAGVVMAGLGLAGLGMMAGFGIDTGQKHNASKPYCTDDRKFCDPTGLDLEKQAHTSATLSNASLAVGATLLAGGVTVFLLGPSLSTPKPAPTAPSTARARGSAEATVSLHLTAGPSSAGALVQGAF